MCLTAVLVEVPHQSLPHVHIVWKMKAWRHDADDRRRVAAQQELFADEGRIGLVSRPPESIADDGDPVAVEEGPIGGEAGPDRRGHAEHREEIGARLDGAHAHRIETRISQVDVRPPPARRVREDIEPAVVHERHRRYWFVGQSASGIRVPQRDELFGRRVRQRPQQHRVDNGVDGDAGAGRESQHQDRDERESRMPGELPNREAESVSHGKAPERRRVQESRARHRRMTGAMTRA